MKAKRFLTTTLIAGMFTPTISVAIHIICDNIEKGRWTGIANGVGTSLAFLPIHALTAPLYMIGTLIVAIIGFALAPIIKRYAPLSWIGGALGVAALQLHLLFPNPSSKLVIAVAGSWVVVAIGMCFVLSPRPMLGRPSSDVDASIS